MTRETDRTTRYDFERGVQFQLVVQIVSTSKAICCEWERLVKQENRAGIKMSFLLMFILLSLFQMSIFVLIYVDLGEFGIIQGGVCLELAIIAAAEVYWKFSPMLKASQKAIERRRKDILFLLGIPCQPGLVATDKLLVEHPCVKFRYVLRPAAQDT